MRICILTQPLGNNYGGILQNYALQQYLIKSGHSTETINWYRQSSSTFYTLYYAIRFLFFKILKFKGPRFPKYKLTPSESDYIKHNNEDFIQRNIILSPHKFKTPKDIIKYINSSNFDAVIVGSDQCWRPRYNGEFLDTMFLEHISNRNIIKIAYAASFGTDNWEMNRANTSKVCKLIKRFDLVTVREDSGILLCRDYLKIKAFQVLDPTMLFDKSFYSSLVSSCHYPNCSGELYYYILDPTPSKSYIISDISKKCGMIPYTALPKYQPEIRTYENVKNCIEDCVFPGVLDWIKGFMEAKMIITDSFHGCVFSIIFNKPFWLIGNEQRGNARLESLLRMFNLEKRYVSHDIDCYNLNEDIDWTSVNSIIRRYVDYSKSLLSLKLIL